MKTAVTICLISTVAFILTLLIVLPTISQEKESRERRKARPDSQPVTTNFYYPENNNSLKSFQKRELFTASVLFLVPLLSMGGLVAAGAAPLYAHDKYKDWKKRRANPASQQPKPAKLSKADENSFRARYEKEQEALKDTGPPAASESTDAAAPVAEPPEPPVANEDTGTDAAAPFAEPPEPPAANEDSGTDAPAAEPPEPPVANEYSSRQRLRSDEMMRQEDCSLLPWYLQEACREEKAYFEKVEGLLKAQYEAYLRKKYYKAYEKYAKQVIAERERAKERAVEAINDKVVKEQQYEEAAGERRQKINRYLVANGRPELPEDKKSSKSEEKSATKSSASSSTSEERIIQLEKTGSGGEE